MNDSIKNFEQSCPACRNGIDLVTIEWGEYSVIHCKVCGLDYCSRMVEKETGGDSSPVHLEGIEMMADSFHKTIDLAKRYTQKRLLFYESLLKRKCTNVLEVGCGPGVFFEHWQHSNVSWTGIDINPYWQEFGKANQIPITNQPIEALDQQFDVVMAHQVIEHVEDPISFMEAITSRLKPKGIIHLELPNQKSLTSRFRQISPILSYDYGFIQPPMHLRAYCKRTINRLLEDCNLGNIMVFTCANTDKIWGQVRNYKFTQKALYSFTGKVGLGSLLIGIAQKDR